MRSLIQIKINMMSIAIIAIVFLHLAAAETMAQQGTFTAVRDLPYAATGLNGNRLDLYLPEGAATPTPLIIWIHGGGWVSGDKTLDQNSVQLQFARSGYAVASINYRLSGTAIFPAQIHDCKAAIRWLRANAAQYNIDPLRVGVWGSSAGGHLAALVGTSNDVADMEGSVGTNAAFSTRVQAVVDWFGPTDFLQMDFQAATQNCSGSNHNAFDSPESRLVGCAIQTCPQAVQRANPLTYFSADDPPFLIQHGTADCTVPTGQSRILQDLLESRAHDTAYLPLLGAGHGGAQFSSAANMQIVSQFFNSKLMQHTALPAIVSGRVLTPTGIALRNARVTIIEAFGSTRTVTTSSFGFYQFASVTPGVVYTFTVSSKRYRYVARNLQIVDDFANLDFIGLE